MTKGGSVNTRRLSIQGNRGLAARRVAFVAGVAAVVFGALGAVVQHYFAPWIGVV
jgi:hypothetical protein